MNLTENQKFFIQLIITILVAYITTSITISQQQSSILAEKIKESENIMNTCNIPDFPKNETLKLIHQAKYYWIYGNYTESERILNNIKPLLKGCVWYAPQIPMYYLLFSIIIILLFFAISFILIWITKHYKKKGKKKR